MKHSRQTIGNIFPQAVVKSLDLSKEHKPVVLDFIQPEFADCFMNGVYTPKLPTVKLKRSMITDRFYKTFDNRYIIEITD